MSKSTDRRGVQDPSAGRRPSRRVRLCSRAIPKSAMIVGVVLVACLALFTAPALASEGHAFSTSFAGTGEHALKAPQGLAINQSTGNVYVVNKSNNRVEEFSESGAFLTAFGTKGTGNGQFEGPTEIAVANGGPNAGDVYVIDGGGVGKGANRVEIFSETGTYLSQVTKAEFQERSSEELNFEGPKFLTNIGVDSSGDLWVVSGEGIAFEQPVGEPLKVAFATNFGVGPGFVVTPGHLRWANGPGVTNVSPTGQNLGGFGFGENPTATGLALDPADEDFYLDRGTVVAHFPAPTSSEVGPNDSFGNSGPEALVKGAGIGVNQASGKVYVADTTANRVNVFAPVTLPTVTLEGATSVVQTGATLHGTVNPEGLEVGACKFEYGTVASGGYAQSAACLPAPGSGTSPVSVSADVSGLTAKTSYQFRLAATNANGVATGGEKGEFKTLAPLLPLTVTKAGTGLGTVTSEAPNTGIDCGPFCTSQFEEGREVELEATAGAGSEFTGWSGADCSGTGVCKVKMTAAEAVTAEFFPVGGAEFPLTVHTEGAGSGTVECDSGSGPGPCAAGYPAGAVIALTAVPGSGSEFFEWTGDCTGPGTCEVTMLAPREVGAVFGLKIAPVVKPGSTKASEIHKTSATLGAEVNPEHASTTYEFEYITQVRYEEDGDSFGSGTQRTTAGALPADTAYHLASKPISGLIPATAYRFRVFAENVNGEFTGETASFETLPYAAIEATYSTEVAATSATIATLINPLGDDTAFHFEYLSQAAYEANGESFSGPDPATVLPVPDADLGSGSEGVSFSRHLQGLAPDTTYRFRVLVTNSLTEADLPGGYHGPTQAFVTQAPGSLELLDDRGWEMVSPPNKQGALIYPIGGSGASNGAAIQAAAGGEAITYVADAPTEPGVSGYANGVQVFSTRTSSGWQSRDIATPHDAATRASVGQGEEYRLFSTDLSRGALQQIGPFTPQLSPEGSEQSPYLRTDFSPSGGVCTESCYRPLVTGAEGFADVPPGTEFGKPCPRTAAEINFFCGPIFEGASPDLGHLALSSEEAALTSTPLPSGTGGLYEWSAEALRGEALQLISLLPKGAGPGSGVSFPIRAARGMLSADGSRAFWSASNGTSLYLRENATEPQSSLGGSGECIEPAKACTVRLDSVRGGSGVGAADPAFQLATTDGSRAFFKDNQQLTPDSGAGAGADLYEWRAEETAGCAEAEGCLTDLTPANGPESAGVQGAVIGASEDGSYVYFVANGVLTEQPDPRGEVAQPGHCNASLAPTATCNLYLSHDGVVGLVAVLSGGDFNDWGLEGDGSLPEMTARVSPNGRWLSFISHRSLTGYDNHDAESGKPDEEVFLYHAGEGDEEASLACPSCNPTGARPQGASSLPGWTPYKLSLSLYQSRFLSDSGRLFFNSRDALVPADSNGGSDVYEYEPRGVGTCAASGATFNPASGGCTDLISSGTSSRESVFLDASEDGNSVFFLTSAQLSGRDTDTAPDVYDARVDGGETEAPRPVECTGDACQQPAVPPNDSTPGSLTFQGAGNVTECPKGKVVKGGKCVKRNQKKPAKKHSKKTNHKKKGKKQKRAGSKHGGQK